MPVETKRGTPREAKTGARNDIAENGEPDSNAPLGSAGDHTMIRKLASGKYRLYSRKKNPKTHKRRNLGTFDTKAAAEKHEREVQYFKRH